MKKCVTWSIWRKQGLREKKKVTNEFPGIWRGENEEEKIKRTFKVLDFLTSILRKTMFLWPQQQNVLWTQEGKQWAVKRTRCWLWVEWTGGSTGSNLPLFFSQKWRSASCWLRAGPVPMLCLSCLLGSCRTCQHYTSPWLMGTREQNKTPLF